MNSLTPFWILFLAGILLCGFLPLAVMLTSRVYYQEKLQHLKNLASLSSKEFPQGSF